MVWVRVKYAASILCDLREIADIIDKGSEGVLHELVREKYYDRI